MLRVVTYHRVAEPDRTPWLHPRMVSATPAVFERHVRHLATRYRAVALDEVLRAARSGTPLPPRAVLVTFDDAYRDFLDAAWPILQAHRVPVVLFVPTAFPGDPLRPFWWDRLYRCFASTREHELRIAPLGSLPLGTPAQRMRSLAAAQRHVKSLPHDAGMAVVEACVAALGEPRCRERAVLSWDELRALAAAGASVCAHSRSHPLLTRLDAGAVREEVEGSMRDLARELGHAPPVFSFPNGAHDDAAVDVLRALGVELAFTQIDGHNDLRRPGRLRLRRTNITRRTTPGVFPVRLQRWATVIDRWRHRERRHPSAA